MGLGTQKNSEHRLHIVSVTDEKFRILPLYMSLGTWKTSTPELPPGLWDLEKFQVLPLYRFMLWDLENFHARASS